MNRLSLACLVLLATSLPAQESKKEPTPPPLWPKGEMLSFSFADSKIFPGTSRNVNVYIPKQYDGQTPACVYINQDGVQNKAPEVFDELISKKEMPVTIGVFVTPGVVKAPTDKALPRFNRSYEYDGLGDGYARFLLEELLPAVETKTTKDGRKIVLSKKGNDRCIAGSSSGAVCAFTAAWERPEEFSRVFSTIGTYVGLRGADIYPTLIRKTEPKAIRIFLQDGSKDLNIYGGDWWMANQSMQRALQFAGYEQKFEWGEGGHSGEHGAKLFPEAMRYLWKDYPNPVKAGGGSSQMKDVLVPGQGWTLVGEGYKFTEGAAVDKSGEFYFDDIPNNKVYKVGVDGKLSDVPSDLKAPNGQCFGPDGSRYVIAMDTEQVFAFGPDGKSRVVAEGFRGNDLVVAQNGNIYVTNPPKKGTTDPSKVWLITPKGEKKVVDEGLKFSNGVTLSPDQSLLYVADARSHWVYSYQIQPDGTLANKQRFYHLHMRDTDDDSGADGMKCDTAGRLYVATRMGVQFCDQAGRVNGIIPSPNGKCSNLAFGGTEFDILYITAGDKVYARRVRPRGANTFDAPIKPKGPQL